MRSKEFEMDEVIKRRDCFSPLLFIIVMDRIVKNIKQKIKGLDT